MTIVHYLGRDCELSSTGIDDRGESIDSWKVTQDVLAHIGTRFEEFGLRPFKRTSTWSSYSSYSYGGSAYSSDCLRHWCPNGQVYYADMSHVEVCTAATPSPRTFAAQCLSTLLVVEAARERAQAEAPAGTRYALSTANVDVLDPAISWGTHLNVSVSKTLWEDLFSDPRHPAILGYVSSAMAAAIAFFGGGYILPLRDGETIFSTSARAHHITRITTLPTTESFRRGILNSRREAHSDAGERMHLIGFDFVLVSAALLGSFVQCLLAAAEHGYCGLGVYDPVSALRNWSWGLNLETGRFTSKARLVDSRELTLPEYMEELTATLLEMVRSGLISAQAAPEAEEHLQLIAELVAYAKEGQVGRCARHLDWAAKVLTLLGVAQRRDLSLRDPVLRLSDHDFASTDPGVGTFWSLWQEGRIDPLVTREEVEACLLDGPAESRGWGRGRLIQQFRDDIADVDWSWVELQRGESRWGSRVRVELPFLDSLNAERLGPVLADSPTVTDLERNLRRVRHAEATDVDPVLDVHTQLDSPRTREGDTEEDRSERGSDLETPELPARDEGRTA